MLLENCVSGGMSVIEKHLSATVPHFRILKFHTCWPHTYFFLILSPAIPQQN